VGDEGCEQWAIRVACARLVAAEWLKSAAEAAPLVDILQQILNPDPRQARLDGLAQLPHRRRDRQRVRLLQLQSSILDRGKTIGGQAARRGAGHPVERGDNPVEKGVRLGRQIEATIGLAAGFLPAPLVINEIPE